MPTPTLISTVNAIDDRDHRLVGTQHLDQLRSMSTNGNNNNNNRFLLSQEKQPQQEHETPGILNNPRIQGLAISEQLRVLNKAKVPTRFVDTADAFYVNTPVPPPSFYDSPSPALLRQLEEEAAVRNHHWGKCHGIGEPAGAGPTLHAPLQSSGDSIVEKSCNWIKNEQEQIKQLEQELLVRRQQVAARNNSIVLDSATMRSIVTDRPHDVHSLIQQQPSMQMQQQVLLVPASSVAAHQQQIEIIQPVAPRPVASSLIYQIPSTNSLLARSSIYNHTLQRYAVDAINPAMKSADRSILFPTTSHRFDEEALLMESASIKRELEALEKKAAASRKAATKDNDEDKPRRPLNAYNFFFSEEREVILTELQLALEQRRKEEGRKEDYQPNQNEIEEILQSPPVLPEAIQKELKVKIEFKTNQVLNTLRESQKSKKGPHRKTHGIGFRPLSKIIAERWKNIGNERKNHYRKLAKKDLDRYTNCMNEFSMN